MTMPKPSDTGDKGVDEQLLHVFIVYDFTGQYDSVVYLGIIPHTQVSNRVLDYAGGQSFRTRVFDATIFDEETAKEGIKNHYKIHPHNEYFYPLVYENTPIGELQQIFGIRPEYTPSSAPFEGLVEWRNKAIAAHTNSLLTEIEGELEQAKLPVFVDVRCHRISLDQVTAILEAHRVKGSV